MTQASTAQNMAPENPRLSIKFSHVLRSIFGWPIVTMFILIALKTFLEHWQPVEAAENWTYKVLQKRMAEGGTTARQDVLVVDIGKIQPEAWERNGRKGTATPRYPLKQLIEVFTDLGARSISVDVDFSPENGQPIHPDDNEFFQWCLDRSKQKHIPILLGVFRTGLRPEEWLGDDRYMRLAAYIGNRDPDRAVYWTMAKGGFPLRGVSPALAGLTWESFINDKNCSWSCLLEPTTIINYSSLPRIRDDVLHAVNPEFYRDEKDKVENRMILLGDAYRGEHRAADAMKTADWFHPTALDEQIPGVFVHACAAATIAANKPIYQLTLLGRVFIDVLIAVFILFLVKFSLWVGFRSELDPAHAERKFDLIYTVIAILVVFVVGFLCVRTTRLLWTDFLIVCLVLIGQLLINTLTPHSRISLPVNSAKIHSDPV